MSWAADYRHLPPGRQAGRQSRRNVRGRRFAFVWVSIFGVPLLVAGIWIWTDGPGADGPFITGVALLMLGLAIHTRRSTWTGRTRHVALTATPEEVRRGEPVSVRLDVTRPLPTLEVGLVCCEHYDVVEVVRGPEQKSKVRETKVAEAYADWRPARTSLGVQEVTFVVPPGAPYSYEGDALSYAWRVSARSEGDLGRKRSLDVPIWVHA